MPIIRGKSYRSNDIKEVHEDPEVIRDLRHAMAEADRVRREMLAQESRIGTRASQ